MAQSDGVAYLYENVGPPATSTFKATAYLYETVGVGGLTWQVGRILFNLDDSYGVAYLYENVT